MKNYLKHLLNIKKNIVFKKEIDLLIKYKYFYKNKIHIFYSILIPRYDTENIITISKKITNNFIKINIYELGCGSNNINKSLNFKYLNNINIDNNFLCYLTKNKIKNKKHIFNDWFFLIKNLKKTTLIITNPPYIEKKELNVNNKIIKNSLISNKNGLNSIYDIIKNSKNILLKNGIIILENGYNQNKKVRKYSRLNGFNTYTFKDNNNIKRFTYLEI